MKQKLWQVVKDELIFVGVGVWIVAAMRREWLRLLKRQLGYGLVRVMVAKPRLANEKYLWRKAFDHDPRWVIVTDKEAAKKWVSDQGIEVSMPATLWSGTDANDIPDDLWQRPFYLKATHGCQMNIAVLNPPDDRDAIIAEANGFLQQDHGGRHRQWAYDGVPRRLIAEEVISPGRELIEVKYYTFGETVEQFVLRREGPPLTAARCEVQDDGGYVLSEDRTVISAIIDRKPLPDVVFEGLKLAAEIGRQFDHVRVDTLTDGDDLYLGELTVYSIAGRVFKNGDDVDAVLNRSWDLRRSWFLTTPQPGWRGVYANALRRELDQRELN